MRLILSTRLPRNSTYFNETGEVLYEVDEPLTLESSVATIRKVVGPVNGGWSGGHEQLPNPYGQYSNLVHNVGHRGGHGFPMSGRQLVLCAQVEFHTFHSSRFRYSTFDVSVKDYFRKEGWWNGRGRRVFTASDGREYRWRLHANHLDMVTNDGSKTQVVEFKEQRQGLGPFRKGRPATLEIHPTCVHILDEIMMTFIYCQKLREDREGDGGGGDGGGGGGDGGGADIGGGDGGDGGGDGGSGWSGGGDGGGGGGGGGDSGGGGGGGGSI